MERSEKKLSPLEALVAYQQAQTSPTKATPKDRFEKSEKNVIIPIIEDPISTLGSNPANKNLVISNSSLVVNFNLNLDSEALDKALEKSKQVAKSVFAAGAAMVGTAFFFSGDKKVPKVKMPLMPKVKLPKIN